MNAIEIKNLTKVYGKNRGIQDINISIKEGEIYGFIGPNGAGKSTTIKTLLNFIYPTSGEALIFGMDSVKESEKIKEHIGYVPSEVRYYDDVKVKDIIKYAQSFYPKSNKEYIDRICNVAKAQSLINNPKLLILDEPTNGLDPLMQKKLFKILIEEKEKGNTVFLSSHNLVEVQNLCDRVCVIKEGKIVDIIEIEKSKTELKLKVTLSSSDITDDTILNLSDKIVDKNGNLYTFIYSKNIDSLVKELANYKIDELLIEKENLEAAFLNYYENNKEEF